MENVLRIKEATLRIPKVNDFCQVNYDGRISNAIVTAVGENTFDIETSYKGKMFNIAFDKFKPMPDLGGLIINMLNEKYSLELKTVDSMSMNDDINELLKNKKWMLDFYVLIEP